MGPSLEVSSVGVPSGPVALDTALFSSSVTPEFGVMPVSVMVMTPLSPRARLSVPISMRTSFTPSKAARTAKSLLAMLTWAGVRSVLA